MTSTRLASTALPCASVLLLTLVSSPSSAQFGAGGIDGGISDAPALSSADFVFSFERYDALAGAWVALNPTEQAFFFDRARCECAEDTSNFTGSIKIAIEPSAAVAQKIQSLLTANLASSGSARLYAGGNAVNCLDPSSTTTPEALSAYCVNLLDPSSYSASIPGGMAVFLTQRRWESPPIPVAWLFGAAYTPVCDSPQSCNQTTTCGKTLSAQALYFWAQTSQTGLPDRSDLIVPINLAGQVPYAPSDVTVEAANEALIVHWTWPIGINPAADPSFLGPQLFCQRGQGDQVFASGTYTAAFTSSAATCPAVAAVPASPLAFANLDPGYLCSGLLPATATSYRISGLQNGIFYGVGVAAVDKYGNLSPAGVLYQAPSGLEPSLDGGTLDGGDREAGSGGCTLAGSRGPRGGWAVLGMLTLGALCFGRMRARGARVARKCGTTRRAVSPPR